MKNNALTTETQFANHEAGNIVIGTSRNPEKYQNKVPFKLLSLDISDDKSIDTFAKQL